MNDDIEIDYNIDGDKLMVNMFDLYDIMYKANEFYDEFDFVPALNLIRYIVEQIIEDNK